MSEALARRIIPLDGVIIDQTKDPMEINLHIHGVKVIIPVDTDVHRLLQERPCQFKLELVVHR